MSVDDVDGLGAAALEIYLHLETKFVNLIICASIIIYSKSNFIAMGKSQIELKTFFFKLSEFI